MVPIKSIKTTSCPVCGCATIISESVEVGMDNLTIRVHCNGGQWEHRKFACGYETMYIPNFFGERRSCACKNDPEVIRVKQKTEELKETILGLVKESDLPDYVKERFDNVRWIT